MPTDRQPITQTYAVTWAMDLDAADPIRAAAKALDVHRRPDSIGTVFDVTAPDGTTTRVDLTEGTAEILIGATQ